MFLNLVYHTSHLDRVSWPLVALFWNNFHAVERFCLYIYIFTLLIGYLCLFLQHRLTNGYIILFLVLQAYVPLS